VKKEGRHLATVTSSLKKGGEKKYQDPGTGFVREKTRCRRTGGRTALSERGLTITPLIHQEKERRHPPSRKKKKSRPKRSSYVRRKRGDTHTTSERKKKLRLLMKRNISLKGGRKKVDLIFPRGKKSLLYLEETEILSLEDLKKGGIS